MRNREFFINKMGLKVTLTLHQRDNFLRSACNSQIVPREILNWLQ